MSKRCMSETAINALLPQTQCGLCGYEACLPYAHAILHEKAPLDQCPPGGVRVLKALGSLLQENVDHLIPTLKTKQPSVAIIDETLCIGCTKCIQVCPTDAIIGSSKQTHTIIEEACTGCDRCLPPCPVDCIDIKIKNFDEPTHKAQAAKVAYESRLARLAKPRIKKQKTTAAQDKTKDIAAAIARVQAKRQKKE